MDNSFLSKVVLVKVVLSKVVLGNPARSDAFLVNKLEGADETEGPEPCVTGMCFECDTEFAANFWTAIVEKFHEEWTNDQQREFLR